MANRRRADAAQAAERPSAVPRKQHLAGVGRGGGLLEQTGLRRTTGARGGGGRTGGSRRKTAANGGILLFSGRARGLAPGEIKLGGGLAVFPRPNQAFWTLSALWAGWLWGREAALPLHPQLGRRRYDWNWHAGALHSPLGAAARLLSPGAPLVGLLPELAPGFLAAVLAASTAAGLSLAGLALRSDEEQAQVLWHAAAGRPAPVQTELAKNTERIFAAGASAHLQERAEPCNYLPIYAAGLEALVQQGALPGPLPERAQLPGDLLTRIQNSDRAGVQRPQPAAADRDRLARR